MLEVQLYARQVRLEDSMPLFNVSLVFFTLPSHVCLPGARLFAFTVSSSSCAKGTSDSRLFRPLARPSEVGFRGLLVRCVMVSRVRRDVRSVLRSSVDAVGPLCFREWALAAEDLRSVCAEAERDGPLVAILI